jgi:hypothetical protein
LIEVQVQVFKYSKTFQIDLLAFEISGVVTVIVVICGDCGRHRDKWRWKWRQQWWWWW